MPFMYPVFYHSVFQPALCQPLPSPSLTATSRAPKFLTPSFSWIILLTVLIVCVLTPPTLGVTVEALKAPIKDLKTSVFGGWMLVVKIAACAAGALFSVFKQGFGPLGIGAGVALGIHFFDAYLGDGADGALI